MSVESSTRVEIFNFIRDEIAPVELTWFDSENTSGLGSMTTTTGIRARVSIAPVDDDSLEKHHMEDGQKVFTCEMMMNAVVTVFGPGAAEVKRKLKIAVAKKSAELKKKNISLKRFSQSGNIETVVGSRYEERAFITLEFAYVDIYAFPRNLVRTIVATGTGELKAETITITEP